jgi:hypothetical protein
MKPVEPLIVHDAKGRAVAVQIKYEDWLQMEAALREVPSAAGRTANSIRGALKSTGDSVEMQRKLRDEWRGSEANSMISRTR